MGNKRKCQALEASHSTPAPKKSRKSHGHVEAHATSTVEPVSFLENPKGADLKHEVELYELLGSEDAAERQDAALAIVSGLFGGEYVHNGQSESVSAATLWRHLERRLFRGLASGRKGARLGFSIVLAEVLSRMFGTEAEQDGKYKELTFEKVMGLLISKTKPEGDLSGQEVKDHSLGLLFGLESLVKARILFVDEWEDRWSAVLDSLFKLVEKKSWVREQCGWVIMEALDQMAQEHAEMTIQKLVEANLAASPEGVGIWLKAMERFPDMRLPSKPWGSDGDPLRHLKDLALALKESSNAGNGQVKQSGSWNPKLHFVWDLVLREYVHRADEKDESAHTDFDLFWKVIVDESLFSETASKERKFWGFSVFQKTLKITTDDDTFQEKFIYSIFSPNLMRCLINHLSNADRFLHRAAHKSLNTILRVVQENPHTSSIIIPNLVATNGTYNFDRSTKTKTIDNILSALDGDDAELALYLLFDDLVAMDGENTKEARCQLFGDYVLSMIRTTRPIDTQEDICWIELRALPYLAKLAYCAEDPRPEKDLQFWVPPLSEKSRTMFRTRLASSLAHLISTPKGFYYPIELLKTFKPESLDGEVEATKDEALATMEKLLKNAKKASDQSKGCLEALALLYAMVIFQVYNGEPDAVSVLDDLKICYEKLVRGKDTGDSEIDASEVLVEILLSFASKPSALLSKTVQHVFSAFSGEVKLSGLNLMTNVLKTSESLKGQQELFDQNEDEEMDADGGEEEDEDEEDGEEEDDLDSDVEVDEAKDGDQNEEDEDEEDDRANVENAKLDAALAQALGTHRLDADLEAESSDSDSDMTDSEMMALDEKLVEIFKQRKKLPNKKQEKKDAKETMVNFKIRVLDLLSIYVKQQTSNPIVYQLLLPLLSLMRTSKSKDLVHKAHGVITALATASKKSKKESSASAINASEQVRLLKAVHEEASKDPSHMFVKAAATTSQLVATSLFRADRANFKKIATVYRDTEVACVAGEMKIHASFFHEWVNWVQSHCASA